jgi:hypothetical protein
MAEHRKEKRRIAQRRVIAAWLALDAHTDAATLSRMIDIAFKGRNGTAGESIGLRVRIIERDKQTCYMCKRKLAIEEITLDHVRPRSRGGDDSEANLKVACEPCNNRKGDRLPEECEWLKQ